MPGFRAPVQGCTLAQAGQQGRLPRPLPRPAAAAAAWGLSSIGQSGPCSGQDTASTQVVTEAPSLPPQCGGETGEG